MGKIARSTKFHRPHTKRLPKNPKYVRSLKNPRNKLDMHSIIKFPLATETALKKIEEHNTLVFMTDRSATKAVIKRTIEKLYEVKVVKVNTLIRLDGLKKAFVKLSPDNDAMEVANKVGLF